MNFFMQPLSFFIQWPKHQLYHVVITLIGNKFEAEIRAEQEENRRKAEDAKVRKQQFKEKQAAFNVS